LNIGDYKLLKSTKKRNIEYWRL